MCDVYTRINYDGFTGILGQSDDCPSVSEGKRNDVAKMGLNLITT